MRAKLIGIVMMLSSSVFAQEAAPDTIDYSWKAGAQGTINFNQVSFKNWAQGGENNIGLQGISNFFLKKKTRRGKFENTLDLAYGVVKTGENPMRKSDDRFELVSKYGLNSRIKNVKYTTFFSIKSQLAEGFKFPNDSVVVSRFLAPAYFLYSNGMDYIPNDHFSVYISPISARLLLVNDPLLSAQGAFGVDSGKLTRFEYGAYFTLRATTNLLENVVLNSKIDLFSNYNEDPQNLDVAIDLLLNMKVNKYLTASITCNLLYDDNTKIPIYEEVNGVETKVAEGPRLQLKQSVGVGISVSF
jgi:hypothetical protein